MPQPVRIAGILFDIGGVLVALDGVPSLAALLRSEEQDETIHDLWMASPSVVAHETGKIEAAEFAARVVVDLRLPVTAECFLQTFRSWPNGPLAGAVELLDEIPAVYRLAALSNMSAAHWETIVAMGLMDRFEQAYLSYETGHLKPAPEAFLFALEGMRLSPSEALFMDDLLPNVEVARALGMHAHLARGPAEARTVLVRHGILPSSDRECDG